ncbi:MAG: hypothetical protein JNL03_02235 [Prolixibacteraceae bacterium]|nr:hypothetical protein [Prolixibacteraceae bacterium]
MKNLIIPMLIVLMMFQNCVPANKGLIPDETAQQIFTPAELKGLDEMIRFVDSKVAENKSLTDVNQVYRAYFDQFSSSVSGGKMFPALLTDSVKFKFLETLGKESFSSVWKLDDHVQMVRYKDTTLTDLHDFKTLGINNQGKYLRYLKEIGKSDSLYSHLYKSMETAGDIPPSVVGWYPAQHKEIDFTLFKNRLWAAVFLLRMGDPLEERVEKYLKEKSLAADKF